MALIDRTVEGGLLRGVERADGLDQALDIVTARNRTAQDVPLSSASSARSSRNGSFSPLLPVMSFSGTRDFWGGG
ncbi:hypothetical protein ACCS96_00835 [Rhizobium ruizarguesonis]|jgi:hypothetical protein